jgi:hypothetical protein
MSLLWVSVLTRLKSHKKFKEKYDFLSPCWRIPTIRYVSIYGVWQKADDGKKYMGFYVHISDRQDGNIAKVFEGVNLPT